MDQLGVECLIRHLDQGAKPVPESSEFYVRHFRMGNEPPSTPPGS